MYRYECIHLHGDVDSLLVLSSSSNRFASCSFFLGGLNLFLTQVYVNSFEGSSFSNQLLDDFEHSFYDILSII